MKKEDKNQLVDSLMKDLKENKYLYLADIGGMDVLTVNNLRRLCYKRNVKLRVVKNTLLKKALEQTNSNYQPLFELLKGPTSIMLSQTGNAPARIIKEFRVSNPKPILKGAFIEESLFVGHAQLESLVNLKSREELIGDIILLLQSPAKNVISALQSGSNKIAGIVKTLSEKAE
jgi:large subunit ribosomal protein L10